MKKLVLIVWASVWLLGSCVNSKDVSFTGVNVVDLKLPKSIDLTVGLENRSAHNLHLLSGEFDLEYNGRRVGTVMLAEPVTVARHFTGDVPVRLRIRITDILTGYAAFNVSGGGIENLTVSGTTVVRAGWMKKKIELKNEPVAQLMSTFGL